MSADQKASSSSNPPTISPRTPSIGPDLAKKVEDSYYYDPTTLGAVAHCTDEGRKYGIKVVSGNANRELAESVTALLQKTLVRATVKSSSCGEVSVKIHEQLMGDDVFIIQPTCASDSGDIDVNTALIELLFMIRRLKLAGAARITAFIPFFAYARQDRKTDLRVPISASAVSAMIMQMGVDRVVTLDLHSGQIQGCFNSIPMDNLEMAYEFARYISRKDWFIPDKCVIVSPDAGGVERARRLADILAVGRIVTIVKRRIAAGQVESMQTVGEVDGLSCIIIDDMCDTGGTLVKACELLREMGAVRVIACCTHGILTEPCSDRVNKCGSLEELVVSDSIPQATHKMNCSKLTVLSIAPLLSTAIMKYHSEESISGLFKTGLK